VRVNVLAPEISALWRAFSSTNHASTREIHPLFTAVAQNARRAVSQAANGALADPNAVRAQKSSTGSY
jgi:hypothetical protein